MEGARKVTISAAGIILICFFLPWIQVSCLGVKDSASGFDLARGGDRALWLVPLLMVFVLLLGIGRLVLERMPALFALCGIVGGGLTAWLMYRERRGVGEGSGLIAAFWTTWYWLSLISSFVVAGASLWFYAGRARAP